MVRSVAYVFLGALFASLFISTITAIGGDHEKNDVKEANQATSGNQLNHFGGGGGGGDFGGNHGGNWPGHGGRWPGHGGGHGGEWPGQGGEWPGQGGGHGDGWPGHGGGGCRWGKCCGRGGYCSCCRTAQEALVYMQNGVLN